MLSTTVGSRPYQFQPAAKPALNPTTRHLLRGDLFKAPVAPFRGDPSLFRSWCTSLERKIVELGLSAGDVIDVLEAHMQGKQRKSFRLSR